MISSIEKASLLILLAVLILHWLFQIETTLFLSVYLNILAIFYLPVSLVWLLTGTLTRFSRIDVFSNWSLFSTVFLFCLSMGFFFAGLFFRINQLPGSLFILRFALVVGLIAVFLAFVKEVHLRKFVLIRFLFISIAFVVTTTEGKYSSIEFITETNTQFEISRSCSIVYEFDEAFDCSAAEDVNIFVAVYDSTDVEVNRKVQAFQSDITTGHILLIQQPNSHKLNLGPGFYIIRPDGTIVASEELSVSYAMFNNFIRVYPTR